MNEYESKALEILGIDIMEFLITVSMLKNEDIEKGD